MVLLRLSNPLSAANPPNRNQFVCDFENGLAVLAAAMNLGILAVFGPKQNAGFVELAFNAERRNPVPECEFDLIVVDAGRTLTYRLATPSRPARRRPGRRSVGPITSRSNHFSRHGNLHVVVPGGRACPRCGLRAERICKRMPVA